MAKAKITLVGPLSYAVGRYRFVKNRPVLTDDEELIRSCQANPDFKTTLLDSKEAAPKKAAPRAKKREAAKKDEAKAKAKEPVQEVKAPKKKAKPEPVSDEVSDEDIPLASSEDSASEKKSASSSKLTRKKKKGDDA